MRYDGMYMPAAVAAAIEKLADGNGIENMEGAVLEMTDGGPVVLTRPEAQAFKKSFRTYAFWRPPVPVPIAIWAFEFQKPLSPMDVNFDAKKARREWVAAYLETHDGLKNALVFHLLDGPILRANKLVGLEPAAGQAIRAKKTIVFRGLKTQSARPWCRYVVFVEARLG